MRTCVNCTATLAEHNSGIRCYVHIVQNTMLQAYVEQREVALVGLERWSAGRTSKRNLRDPYVRKFRGKGIPWEATLEEVEVCDPDRFLDLLEELDSLSTGKELDEQVFLLSFNEAILIDALLPETNFLTKWTGVLADGCYQRFRSAFDEQQRTEDFQKDFHD